VKQEELQQYYNAKQIVIHGRGCPKPVFSFEEANFPGQFFFVIFVSISVVILLMQFST